MKCFCLDHRKGSSSLAPAVSVASPRVSESSPTMSMNIELQDPETIEEPFPTSSTPKRQDGNTTREPQSRRPLGSLPYVVISTSTPPRPRFDTFNETSQILIMQHTGNNNAYLCKRKKQAGGVMFSRDPMNLTNKHSRKDEGFVNEKAIGITADSNTVNKTPSPPAPTNHFPPTNTRVTGPTPHQNPLQIPHAPRQHARLLLRGLHAFAESVQERGELDGEEGVSSRLTCRGGREGKCGQE